MGQEPRKGEAYGGVSPGADIDVVPALREWLRTGGGVGPSPAPGVVAEIAGQLEQEKSAIAIEILKALQREIPEYAAVRDPQRIAELLLGGQTLISVFARIMQSEPGLSDEEWEFVKNLGKRRAEEGFPLSAIVSAFHIGMNVGWDYMAQRLHLSKFSPHDANTMMVIALQLLHFIGDVTRRVCDAYLAEAPSVPLGRSTRVRFSSATSSPAPSCPRRISVRAPPA